jgi:hypothetical protein
MTDCTERHTPHRTTDVVREGQKGIAKEAQP